MAHLFRRRLLAAAFTAALLPSLVACTTPGEPTATEPAAEVAEKTSQAEEIARLNKAAAAAYEERLERERLEEAIVLWEQALELKESAEILEALSRAYYFKARYHEFLTPDPDRERVLQASEQGVEYGLAALALRAPEFHRSLLRGAPFEEELAEANVEAVDAMIAYAQNLDLWAKTKSISASVSAEPLVDAVMTFVLEHSPEAHFGAAPRYFGSRWVERPFHRSPEKSAAAFAASLEIAPQFQITRVLRARTLAVHTGDRALFEADLRAVIEADPASFPEARAENAVARQLAEALLAQVDTLF